ncbi:MAG TPA: CRISPR-associated endonuclease Cas2 [Flexilinea sp.]|nr:CRISPR-associated endonuclease Cas2 [Flexilinea sp.]
MNNQNRSFCLIAYDIADNQRRLKVSKILESYSNRVQESVFEGFLTRAELEKIIKRVEKIIEKQEDSLRVYFICEECRKKMILIGNGEVTHPPELIIL